MQKEKPIKHKKMSFKCRGGSGGGKRRRVQPYPGEHQAPGYYDRREQWGPPPPMVPQRPYRARVLGPCFQCGDYRHVAKFCSGPNRPYPFSQPVVSSAVVHEPSTGLDELSLCCEIVSSVIAKSTHILENS